jgi:hypothetical protein
LLHVALIHHNDGHISGAVLYGKNSHDANRNKQRIEQQHNAIDPVKQ